MNTKSLDAAFMFLAAGVGLIFHGALLLVYEALGFDFSPGAVLIISGFIWLMVAAFFGIKWWREE